MPGYDQIEWSDAACAGVDTELFYRVEEFSGRLDPILMALTVQQLRQLCASCPIWSQCLGYATYHEFHGIWGGMTSAERKAIRERNHQLRLRVLAEFSRLGISARQIDEAVEGGHDMDQA